jgi:uncharacterized membrane protein
MSNYDIAANLYSDMKREVDSVVNSVVNISGQRRFFPFKIPYIQNRVSSPFTEEFIYTLLIFLLMSIILLWIFPSTIQDEYVDENTGELKKTTNYNKLIKYSFVYTILIVLCLTLYKSYND